MYVVIFRSTRTFENSDLYHEWSNRMEQAVRTISGYQSHFGFRDESSRQGVTVSYFDSEESISEWREFLEHQTAQALGREHFYEEYSVDVARIERRYDWRK